MLINNITINNLQSNLDDLTLDEIMKELKDIVDEHTKEVLNLKLRAQHAKVNLISDLEFKDRNIKEYIKV